jgi:hypothetical protein
MKRSLALLIAAGVLFASSLANAAPKAVWKDASGDVSTTNTGPVPELGQAGFDLTGGSIDKKGANLIFSVKQASMPPFGAIPEAVRFTWSFAVNGKSYRVTAKRLNVGKPNPATQEDADQVGQASPDGFFRLEGNCDSTPLPALLTLVNCHTLGYLKGTWDPAKATFTFTVPMKSIKAKPGAKITTASGDAIGICTICWVSHVAERSHQDTVLDAAIQTTTYKVPR